MCNIALTSKPTGSKIARVTCDGKVGSNKAASET